MLLDARGAGLPRAAWGHVVTPLEQAPPTLSADLAVWRYLLTWTLVMCGTEAVREILDAQNRSYEAARRRADQEVGR